MARPRTGHPVNFSSTPGRGKRLASKLSRPATVITGLPIQQLFRSQNIFSYTVALFIWCVRKIAKSDHDLRHISPPPPAWFSVCCGGVMDGSKWSAPHYSRFIPAMPRRLEASKKKIPRPSWESHHDPLVTQRAAWSLNRLRCNGTFQRTHVHTHAQADYVFVCTH